LPSDIAVKKFPVRLQVAAQTGHKVTLVDISQEVLDKSAARIGESIKRVAKKECKDDQVSRPESILRISISAELFWTIFFLEIWTKFHPKTDVSFHLNFYRRYHLEFKAFESHIR
jgi:hypothetical protein